MIYASSASGVIVLGMTLEYRIWKLESSRRTNKNPDGIGIGNHSLILVKNQANGTGANNST